MKDTYSMRIVINLNFTCFKLYVSVIDDKGISWIWILWDKQTPKIVEQVFQPDSDSVFSKKTNTNKCEYAYWLLIVIIY